MSDLGQYASVQAPVKQVHINTDQEVIQITLDKLQIVLGRYETKLEQRNAWVAPLSLIIAIVTVFATSNFKQALFTADQWETGFAITGVICAGWFISALVKGRKSPTVADVIAELKAPTSRSTL